MEVESTMEVSPESGAPETSIPASGNDHAKEDSNSSPLTLDSVDKFVFQGHEYTPEELNRSMLRMNDYTKKTQEIAQEKKFYENLPADLEHIRGNPHLADQFKKLYPSKFHRYVDLILANQENGKDEDDSGNNVERMLPKSVVDKLKKLDQMEEKLARIEDKSRSNEEAVASKHLDTVFAKYSDKYPYAVEDTVLNQAQALLDANQENPRFKLTEATWERIFKGVNDKYQKQFETKYRNQIESQVKKSERASDSGPGGSAPGRGPSGPRTFAEATEMAIQDLKTKGAR